MARAPHLRAAVHSLVCLSLAVLLSGCGTGYQHHGIAEELRLTHPNQIVYRKMEHLIGLVFLAKG